jgi:hypothetical protein
VVIFVISHTGMRYGLMREVLQGLEMLATTDTLCFRNHMHAGPSFHNGPTFGISVAFPSCVATRNGCIDGEPILSFRNMPGEAAGRVNSHVADPAGTSGNEVGCLSHPYRYPGPEFVINFDRDAAGSNPYLSSDAMAGSAPMSTLHGDDIFGIDAQTSRDILRCVQEAREYDFSGGARALPERLSGPLGQVFNGNNLAASVDRTPFGTSLTPVFNGGSASQRMSGHHHHHHEVDQLDNTYVYADMLDQETGELVGQLFDGARLSSELIASRDVSLDVVIPDDLQERVSSAEIIVNGISPVVDNDPPYSFTLPDTISIQEGADIQSGANSLLLRFYEQSDLGGSYIGERRISFYVQ